MLVTILALVAILAGMLAIPVAVDFRVRGVPLEEEVRVVWAFGLVNVRLKGSPGANVDVENMDVEIAGDTSAGGRSNPLAAFRQRDFRRRLLRFAKDMWRAVRKQDLRLYARLGLGDPAETGQLWALLGPLSGILNNVEDAEIEIEPDFANARFEFDGSGRIAVVPLEILGIVVSLALSPPIWRGLKAMRA